MPKQFTVVLVNLDPTIGAEIKKTRPCLVVSPDEMNGHLHTVIIAPMTSKGFPAAFRVPTTFNHVKGIILLDQLRSIDKHRIVKTLGPLNKSAVQKVRQVLLAMFS